ncbi:hypothetical protein [Halovivax limisalsi]|uniref:hypothetical protein n=1 Tax=Halovivax limisalsi TaxID=1453760 RepID=UPI001FFCEBC4|nr:hypothetical protein [Halovivax limisalsi]
MTAEPGSDIACWDDRVEGAFDPRVVALIVVLSGLAASVNVPYGGFAFAAAAFLLLCAAGLLAHFAGQRRLQRITAGLAAHWEAHGATVEGITRDRGWSRTAWVVHTTAGPITVSGLALAPLSKVSIEWEGTGDVLAATDAEERLDSLAAEWYQEVRYATTN